ncbi:oligopeptidase A [Ahniella affigens]|uniref:oligopeptidase A n=1 Tax=Ahniella affigens TaxID=2021234 RepID=A0A2P1PV61_9GAMM|nr:M3 family metallopeptidase [Ahniella affigens]AVP98728.1 oligopeptidase A [Ahniella affigens]
MSLTLNWHLPDFSRIDIARIVPELEARLADNRARIDALSAQTAPDFDALMGAWEDIEEQSGRWFQPISHLHNVRDQPELREAYGEAIELLTDYGTWVGQHAGLCAKVKALQASPDFPGLNAAAQKLVADALRDFRLSGVDLPPDQRERYKTIANQLARLSTEFEQAVLDATEAWSLDVPEGDTRLLGLPPSALAQFKDAAEQAGVTGYRISLKAPSYLAVLTYAEDRGLRETLYAAYQTRASDQGPNAGTFDNTARIHEVMRLRQESAQLLGFETSAHESLAGKMAVNPAQVLAFLQTLAEDARPQAQRDLDELNQFAREHLNLESLAPWDIAFVSEKLKQAKHQISDEDLKPYFPVDPVLAGMFGLVERLFGIRIRERQGVDRWHPDVRFFELVDAHDDAFAGFYLDLFARTGKRGGAWMDVCTSRRLDGTLVQVPVAFLTCNAPPPTRELPSLLTHDDVVTLFHEFGHGLHHMLTEVGYPSLAGIEGVEWDAVELPSQFLENFAWDPNVLRALGRHWEHGDALPEDLIQKLLATRHDQAGMFLVRQLEFALFDFRLHLEYQPGLDLQALIQSIRNQVAVVQPPAWQRFAHSFTHIFSGGYAAGYYSYLWAQVLSADAFEQFRAVGGIDPALGRRFREAVLAVGGSRPAAESVRAFLGRDPDPKALLRSYGIATRAH